MEFKVQTFTSMAAKREDDFTKAVLQLQDIHKSEVQGEWV